jgi:hypothetical protein
MATPNIPVKTKWKCTRELSALSLEQPNSQSQPNSQPAVLFAYGVSSSCQKSNVGTAWARRTTSFWKAGDQGDTEGLEPWPR